uniref:NADH-ubiquinone oxidoreductase chain 3 n=1 Tax=Amblyomma testudinarium TaxID=375577 RepID=A0A6M3RVF1_AMBTS|nr:NADH dehydrogenase subunit 3 [Amblyomma testudinarium]
MLKYFLLITFLVASFIIVFLILFMKMYASKEKLSPFECGFDPFSMSRVPFSLKFFFIGIVFLIFDVEIIVIIPYPLLLYNKNLSLIISFLVINLIIILGLLIEWKGGMIDWLK